jgi:hypothetical protein
LSKTLANVSPVDLRPLTKQRGGWLDDGQPVSGKPLTRERGSSHECPHWERCARGALRTVSVVNVQGALLPRTSWRRHPLVSSVQASLPVNNRAIVGEDWSSMPTNHNTGHDTLCVPHCHAGMGEALGILRVEREWSPNTVYLLNPTLTLSFDRHSPPHASGLQPQSCGRLPVAFTLASPSVVWYTCSNGRFVLGRSPVNRIYRPSPCRQNGSAGNRRRVKPIRSGWCPLHLESHPPPVARTRWASAQAECQALAVAMWLQAAPTPTGGGCLQPAGERLHAGMDPSATGWTVRARHAQPTACRGGRCVGGGGVHGCAESDSSAE